MAKADFPLNIDRRRLLALTAALPAASILPGVKPAAAAPGVKLDDGCAHAGFDKIREWLR
jgi:hypothetical protein